MARSESLVLPASPEPAGGPEPGALGPGGVWPPRRSDGIPIGRSRFDPPTVPILLAGMPEAQPRAGPRRSLRRSAPGDDPIDVGTEGSLEPTLEPHGRVGAALR